MSACQYHKEKPVVGHHSCPGCEVETLRADIDHLKSQNKELRNIISECASACGAAVSPDCSLTFMSGLPEEIRLAILK